MSRALRPCTTSGCPNLTNGGRCPDCHRAKQREYDARRESQAQRGYNTAGHRRFRRQVLTRDPLCVLCGDIATVADHWPTSRRDLIAQGKDPNDPNHGRGLCASCHGRETAAHQPGGWNYR